MRTGDEIEPLLVGIKTVSALTGESEWTTKNKLRLGIYEGRKSGRRTLIVYASVKAHVAGLPRAKFAPPPRKSSRQGRR